MAMPWSRAKAKRAALLNDAEGRKRLTELFDACFRIQGEACEAAGHHIPMVVENVRGAQKWVGRSRWNFGSFHLWGDVPALMPIGFAVKVPGLDWNRFGQPGYRGEAFNTHADRNLRRTAIGNGERFTSRRNDGWFGSNNEHALRQSSSRSPARARARARAQVSKIPLPLARHIAKVYKP